MSRVLSGEIGQHLHNLDGLLPPMSLMPNLSAVPLIDFLAIELVLLQHPLPEVFIGGAPKDKSTHPCATGKWFSSVPHCVPVCRF